MAKDGYDFAIITGLPNWESEMFNKTFVRVSPSNRVTFVYTVSARLGVQSKQRLIRHAVTANAINCVEQIFEANFLTFVIAPTVVRNWDFDKTVTATRKFGRDLWFDSKTILLYRDVFEDFSVEGFVARLHVRQIQTAE